MLAYAANRPVAGKRPSSPPAMLLIISVHVALIAAIMSAKMEFRPRPVAPPPLINVPIEPPPPPNVANPVKHQHTNLTRTESHVTTKPREDPQVGGAATDGGPTTLGGGGGGFPVDSWPTIEPVRHDASLLTSPNDLKPPYPELKILSGEEATLHLRLTISESGRVTAVDPVGPADRVFLDAARRYLITHWRYSPATEDGRAIASSVVISLRFQLDG